MTADDQRMLTLAREVVEVGKQLLKSGLVINSAGNVSVRCSVGQQEGFLITPSGLAYEELLPHELLWMPLKSDSENSAQPVFLKLSTYEALNDCRTWKPSSEWQMHQQVYLQCGESAQAVVHTHSTYATALACQNLEIPAFHYMVAVTQADRIPVAPYARFASYDLAFQAAGLLKKQLAILLEHHGVLVRGQSLTQALSLAIEVENLAHQYTIVRSLGTPRILSTSNMQAVHQRFKTYGNQSQ